MKRFIATAVFASFIAAGALFAACIFPYSVKGGMDYGVYRNEMSASSDEVPLSSDDGGIDWDALKSDNPSVCAWVRIPGTYVDYPVVAADDSDPQFYLDHNFLRQWDPAGTPYLDSGCDSAMSMFNALICAHSLVVDGMFSCVKEYSDRSFFDDHRTIEIYTPGGMKCFQVVAVNVVDGDTEPKRVAFGGMKDYWDWWKGQLEESEIVSDDAPEYPIRNVCLATCSYQDRNSRTLVYAVAEGESIDEGAMSSDVSEEGNGPGESSSNEAGEPGANAVLIDQLGRSSL